MHNVNRAFWEGEELSDAQEAARIRDAKWAGIIGLGCLGSGIAIILGTVLALLP